MKGYIKLHREICDNPLWTMKPFSKGQAWIDLLLLTNYTDSNILVGNTKIHVKRGQVFRAIHTLEERWGWSSKKVRLFLGILEQEKMITTKGTKQGTFITIENWDLYQVEGQIKGQQKGEIRARKGQSTRMIKNDKEKDPPVVPQLEKYPNEIQEAFMDFMEMREKIKAPMTERAITIALSEMDKLSGGDTKTAVAILEQSIMNNWKGLFELKEYKPEKPLGLKRKKQKSGWD